MRKNECVRRRGDRGGKDKDFINPRVCFRVFILFSSALFLCLMSYDCSRRQNKSTYETLDSRIPRTNYEVKCQVENSGDQLSACPRSELFMADKGKDDGE